MITKQYRVEVEYRLEITALPLPIDCTNTPVRQVFVKLYSNGFGQHNVPLPT